MIHRDTDIPQDGRKWSFVKDPTRTFVELLDGRGYDVYIVKDPAGDTWAVYAKPVLDTEDSSGV